MTNSWTEYEDNILRLRMSENVAYSAIGDEIGRTKNSCISRARTLGIAGTGRRIPRTRESVFFYDLPKPPRVEGTGFRLIELAPGQCRYPIGSDEDGHLFCGKQTERISYCDEHHELCWVPRRLK